MGKIDRGHEALLASQVLNRVRQHLLQHLIDDLLTLSFAGCGVQAVDQGDQLLVVGTVRRRFFRSGGSTQSRTEVVASEVLPLTRKRQVRAALVRAGTGLQAESA